ncbi:MAG: lactate utilization protein [Deltaproteobacteria bacterium]
MEPVTRKETLLARVRVALHRQADVEIPAPGREPDRSGPGTAAERLARFRERFEAVGGIVLAAPSPEAALPALGETLRMEGITALLFPADDETAVRLGEALVPLGPFRVASGEEIRRPDPPPTAGIQTAEFAIAETGTIVQTSRGGKTLLPGLLTDIHVALVPAGIVRETPEECLRELSEDPPRNLSFITGPSRTADIELALTIGVHGPRGVIAILLP